MYVSSYFVLCIYISKNVIQTYNFLIILSYFYIEIKS